MDVTNLAQFESIITDYSNPPSAVDTAAFVQPVVRTFEDAIRFVDSSMDCSPAARTVLKTALRQIAWGVSVVNARDSGAYLDPNRKNLDLARIPFDLAAINGALAGVTYRMATFSSDKSCRNAKSGLRRIGRELPPPKAFAQHSHWPLRAVFGSAEIPPHDGLNAHGGKKIAACHGAMYDLRRALSQQRNCIHGRGGVRRHRVEAVSLTAPVAIIGRRYLQLRQRRMGLPDPDQLAGIAKRERLNENRINDSEKPGVGSDAQGQGKNRSQRERRPAAEGTHGGSHFSSLPLLAAITGVNNFQEVMGITRRLGLHQFGPDSFRG